MDVIERPADGEQITSRIALARDENFLRQKARRVRQRGARLVEWPGAPEIDEHAVAVRAHDDVVRSEVPMPHRQSMKRLESLESVQDRREQLVRSTRAREFSEGAAL